MLREEWHNRSGSKQAEEAYAGLLSRQPFEAVHATRLNGRWLYQVLSATPPYQPLWDCLRLKNAHKISAHVIKVLAGRAGRMC
jgi:hypothetical protein